MPISLRMYKNENYHWSHEVAQSLSLSRPTFTIEIIPLYELIHVCRI
jgi:hypothetical protein